MQIREFNSETKTINQRVWINGRLRVETVYKEGRKFFVKRAGGMVQVRKEQKGPANMREVWWVGK